MCIWITNVFEIPVITFNAQIKFWKDSVLINRFITLNNSVYMWNTAAMEYYLILFSLWCYILYIFLSFVYIDTLNEFWIILKINRGKFWFSMGKNLCLCVNDWRDVKYKSAYLAKWKVESCAAIPQTKTQV